MKLAVGDAIYFLIASISSVVDRLSFLKTSFLLCFH